MYEKLIELAAKLEAEGRSADAALVYSAAFKVAPVTPPKHENVVEAAPGFYLHTRRW